MLENGKIFENFCKNAQNLKIFSKTAGGKGPAQEGTDFRAFLADIYFFKSQQWKHLNYVENLLKLYK